MAAETSSVTGIAGRYATALFDLALEGKAIDAVAEEMRQLARLIEESADLKRLVRSPLIGREEQMRAMAAVLERAGASPLVRRFVGVVARNRRLFVLPQMLRDFRILVARHKGELVARVVAATPLSDRQVDQLKAALRDALKSDVSVDVSVDPDLIGGLTVRYGSRLIDASLRSKLQSLKFAMKGVA